MADESSHTSRGNEVHVDIGTVSSAGHVVVAGGDATVIGSTRGDGSETHTLTIGGVETDEKEFSQLQQALGKLEKAIQTSSLDPEATAAAQHNAENLKKQLTSKEKPNEHILVQAAEALFDYGPDITGAVIGAFTTPLVGKIISYMSERALKLYHRIRQMGTGNSTE